MSVRMIILVAGAVWVGASLLFAVLWSIAMAARKVTRG